jgi:hypothetical protein
MGERRIRRGHRELLGRQNVPWSLRVDATDATHLREMFVKADPRFKGTAAWCDNLMRMDSDF